MVMPDINHTCETVCEVFCCISYICIDFWNISLITQTTIYSFGQFIYSFKIHTIELDIIVLYDMYVYLFAEVCCTPAVGFCRSSTSPASLTIFDKIIHCRRSSDPPGIQSQPWRQSASVFENDAPRHAAQNVHGAAVAVCELLVWKYEKKYTRRVTRQCWTFRDFARVQCT